MCVCIYIHTYISPQDVMCTTLEVRASHSVVFARTRLSVRRY